MKPFLVDRPITNSDTKNIFKTSIHIKELMNLERRNGLTKNGRGLGRGGKGKTHYKRVFKKSHGRSCYSV